MKIWTSLLIVYLFKISCIRSAYLPEIKNEYIKFINIPNNEKIKANEIEKFVRPALERNGFFTKMLHFGVQLFNLKRLFKHEKEMVTSSATCFGCKVVVSLLQHFIEEKKTEDEISHIFDSMCNVFRIESPRVCEGITDTFKNEVVQVFSKIALSPDEVCGLLLGDSCATVFNPFHNWTVSLPPVPKPPNRPIPQPKPEAPVIRVLHISDNHFDPYYLEGSNAECNEPLCCRLTDGQPIDDSKKAGKWGDYRNCDTPLHTFEHLLKHVSNNHKIDYVIWTGDIPPHDVWNQTRKEQIDLLHSVTKMVLRYLKGVPVFPAIGNHESYPVDSFPIPEITGNDSISWLYDEIVEAWKPWLPSTASSTLKKGGFYSVKVNTGFRIISINMNYCNVLNWWLLINTTDPVQQLQWLINELQTAELSGEKVHIIGHIPPGNNDCLQIWSNNYYRIINRYNNTVMAQFFGHTHMDEFEVFYDEATLNQATSIAYIGPSVTTYGGVNPGYRIYTVDGNYVNSTRMVLDHETYYLNLTEANLSDEPTWKLEYSAKKAFNMTSLLPLEWDGLLRRFQNDDKLFQTFYRYYRKMSDFYKDPCVDDCKHKLLCRLHRGRSHDTSLPFCQE